MMTVAIIIKSYFNLDGYLSPDSTNYLKLAQNLLEGKGYYVSAFGNTGQDREFFAIWPVGYPTLIFLTAKLTGLSVFWASKFLNIILIGVILGIFRALFKHNAYVYGLILLFSAYIEIFSYTWSETLFITALVWFATSIYFFIKDPTRVTFLYFSIMAASLLLFMSRYIGAFSFGLIGLFGLYYGLVKKDRTKAMVLIGIAIVNIGIMVLYLYHNYIETGFPTGMKRIPSPETNLQLFYMLLKAMIAETLIPIQSMSIKAIMVLSVQFPVFGFLLWKYRKNILRINNSANQQPITLSFVFGAIGLVYLFFIILMRWVSQFDGYGYRLLAPGSFFLFVGMIYFIQQRGTKQFFNAFKSFLLLFAILSYLLNVPYKAWLSSTLNPTYFQALETLKERYKNVEKDSIIVFAPGHINYLYMDMQSRTPYRLPYSPYKENWSDFIKRVNPKNKKNIYLSTPKKELSAKHIDKSVVDFVKKYDKGKLVKLR
jgi:hypothetical protein